MKILSLIRFSRFLFSNFRGWQHFGGAAVAKNNAAYGSSRLCAWWFRALSLVRRLKRFDKLRSTLRALWACIRKPDTTCAELLAVVVATCGPRFVRLRPHSPEVVRDALSFGLGFSFNFLLVR